MNKIKILCVLCVGLYMGFAFADSEEYTQCNYVKDLSFLCKVSVDKGDKECKSPHNVICNPTNSSDLPNFYKNSGFMETTTPLERIVFTVEREGEVVTNEINAAFLGVSQGVPLNLSKESKEAWLKTFGIDNVNVNDINIVRFNVAKDTPLYYDVHAADKHRKAVGSEIECEYVQKKSINYGSLPQVCQDLLKNSNQCKITGKCLATISCTTGMYNPALPAFSKYNFEQDIICSAVEKFGGYKCPSSVEECISDTSVGMQTIAQDTADKYLDEQKVIIQDIRTRTKGNSGGVQ